jgi:hypothetical protein
MSEETQTNQGGNSAEGDDEASSSNMQPSQHCQIEITIITLSMETRRVTVRQTNVGGAELNSS